MIDPLFWLGFSLLLVAVSLTAVLIVALPALQELARAARSAEKLFDTLNRELPPTLEALRLTGLEISDLTDDMSEGVQNAGRVVQQLDQSMNSVRQQARQAQVVTSSLVSGFQVAWKTFARPARQQSSHRSKSAPSSDRPSTSHELTEPARTEFDSDNDSDNFDPDNFDSDNFDPDSQDDLDQPGLDRQQMSSHLSATPHRSRKDEDNQDEDDDC